MEKALFIVPFMTLLANVAILLHIPVFQQIIVFMFLSFIPGFTFLNLFRLEEVSFLDVIIFSVALSIAFVMFITFLINEIYVFVGVSQALSPIPLTIGISGFTMAVFLFECKDLLKYKIKATFDFSSMRLLPLIVLLLVLPILSAIAVLYLDLYLILLSYAIIAVLCVLSVASRRLVPKNVIPLVIFSICVALACQVPLTSKYIVGFDANLEYYVFRMTQINGHWGFLNSNFNALVTITYNSMLSITLLPAAYSSLMNAQGDTVFKLLYPFLFCLTPLVLYRICEKQFGQMIGFFSALVFVFTSTAFYGVEPLGLNRQIVGELFLVICVFLLINKSIPVVKRRWLLVIFGTALAVSHYDVAYLFLGIITVIFVISKVRPKFDDTLDGMTVLILFFTTFGWYAVGTSSLLYALSYTVRSVFGAISAGVSTSAGAASMFAIPQVFSLSTYVNLALSGIVNVFLIIGLLVIIVWHKRIGISLPYALVAVVAGAVLAVSYISPDISSILNFTRFYGITFLFLSLCVVIGGKSVLEAPGKLLAKIKRQNLKFRVLPKKGKNINLVFLLIAIILAGYFLSQVGFVNRVTNGPIHDYVVDFERILAPNQIQEQISILYDDYIPVQDAFSASWLANYGNQQAEVFADPLSESTALLSYGLIPNVLLIPITNSSVLVPNSYVYLDTLNMVDGVITTANGTINTSQISPMLNQSNLVYTNGNSEIWYDPTH